MFATTIVRSDVGRRVERGASELGQFAVHLYRYQGGHHTVDVSLSKTLSVFTEAELASRPINHDNYFYIVRHISKGYSTWPTA